MIQTKRILLRPWREEDIEPYASMNADLRVMEFFESTWDLERSEASARRQMAHQEEHGYCMFAAEIEGEFAGFIGLMQVNFDTGFPYADEIGWRLAHKFWGKGYATEGAKACLDYAFTQLDQGRIVAFTVPANIRSRNVMDKIGMHELGYFNHPRVSPDNAFYRHVLYEINRAEQIASALRQR